MHNLVCRRHAVFTFCNFITVTIKITYDFTYHNISWILLLYAQVSIARLQAVSSQIV
jgi:hypothetical protein